MVLRYDCIIRMIEVLSMQLALKLHNMHIIAFALLSIDSVISYIALELENFLAFDDI